MMGTPFASLGFVLGVLICLLIVAWVLPPLIRYHCAEVMRSYQHSVQAEPEIRVIFIDRGGARRYVAHPSHSARPSLVDDQASVPTDRSRGVWRIDAPSRQPGNAQRNAAEDETAEDEQAILRHIYEQNVHLREHLVRRSTSEPT